MWNSTLVTASKSILSEPYRLYRIPSRVVNTGIKPLTSRRVLLAELVDILL